MSKLNHNRRVHQQHDAWIQRNKEIAKMPLGDTPVQYNNTMKFGKYKGKRFKDIPTHYLEWLVSVTVDDTQALKYCEELAKR